MPRIDPSRQDSMSASIFRFYHNQNWAKIEFYMKFGRKSTKFHVFQINLIIRFVGYSHAWPKWQPEQSATCFKLLLYSNKGSIILPILETNLSVTCLSYVNDGSLIDRSTLILKFGTLNVLFNDKLNIIFPNRLSLSLKQALYVSKILNTISYNTVVLIYYIGALVGFLGNVENVPFPLIPTRFGYLSELNNMRQSQLNNISTTARSSTRRSITHNS